LVARTLTAESTLGGYRITTNTTVVVTHWTTFRDQANWGPDATEFRPGRAKDSTKFFPFSLGPRRCMNFMDTHTHTHSHRPPAGLGPQLAQLAVKAVVAAIVRHFDVEVISPRTPGIAFTFRITLTATCVSSSPFHPNLGLLARAQRPSSDSV